MPYVCYITVDSSALIHLEVSHSFIKAHLTAAAAAGGGVSLSVVLECVTAEQAPSLCLIRISYNHTLFPGHSYVCCEHVNASVPAAFLQQGE